MVPQVSENMTDCVVSWLFYNCCDCCAVVFHISCYFCTLHRRFGFADFFRLIQFIFQLGCVPLSLQEHFFCLAEKSLRVLENTTLVKHLHQLNKVKRNMLLILNRTKGHKKIKWLTVTWKCSCSNNEYALIVTHVLYSAICSCI